MKGTLKHGVLTECKTHGKKRTFKTKSAAPKNKCPVCWMVWLSDRLEGSIYSCDMADLCRFANAMNKIQFKKIELVEECKDE